MSRTNAETPTETEITFVDRIVAVMAFACFIGGIAIIGWQCLTWLQTGRWVAIPLWPTVDTEQGWIGLQIILNSLPLSICLGLGGVGIASVLLAQWRARTPTTRWRSGAPQGD